MPYHEYECYEVKLNRLCKIQSKENKLWLAALLCISAVAIVSAPLFKAVTFGHSIIICIGCFLIMTVKLFSAPGFLDVTPETVKFQYHTALLTLLTTGRLRFGLDDGPKYTKTYTLYNIRSIEYFRTPFEKVFSCGHIQICGDVNIEDSTEKEERTFIIYGIKDFENTAEWMKEYIRISE